ncbi:MAG: NUDIX domain-containing protein [Anaerolineales bacterium]|nr:NUDIX domain-containing protein [Anaerolineales bacterium]
MSEKASPSPHIGRFLAGIAALIYDPQTQRYLLLRRASDRDFGADRWECVTGRVDQGESFAQSLHREVGEEIGGRVQIDFIVGTSHFYRGPATPEYELLSVLYGCTILNPDEIRFGAEHSEMRWVSADEALVLFPQGYWLREVIQRAETLRAHLPAVLIDMFHQNEFEII